VPVVALGVATELLSARIAVSGFAAVLAAVVARVSGPLLRRSAGPAGPAGPAANRG
jgi:hypothetical protein